MKRIPEPELMLKPEQVIAYAEADFEWPHSNFIKLIHNKLPNKEVKGKAIDLGCGPGDITFRFATEFPDIKVHALDGSIEMIRYANNVLTSSVDIRDRVIFINSMIDEYRPTYTYDWIISNSLLHHLPDPMIFWDSLKSFARSGSHVFIMDLFRPESMEAAMALTNKYTEGEPDALKNDFYNSLISSFDLEEIKNQLVEGELDLSVEIVSDRHIIIYGVI